MHCWHHLRWKMFTLHLINSMFNILRSDSPGHCAKYGTYSLIEERTNKIIDLQLVQVSIMLSKFFISVPLPDFKCYTVCDMLQSSEVPNSTWCELEGLKRSMVFLKNQNLHVSTLTTDRHRQVKLYIYSNTMSVVFSHLDKLLTD